MMHSRQFNKQVQPMRVLVVIPFFRIFETKLFCFLFSMCDPVHGVETIQVLC